MTTRRVSTRGHVVARAVPKGSPQAGNSGHSNDSTKVLVKTTAFFIKFNCYSFY